VAIRFKRQQLEESNSNQMFTTLFATSTQQLRQYSDGSKIGYLMNYKGKWKKYGRLLSAIINVVLSIDN